MISENEIIATIPAAHTLDPSIKEFICKINPGNLYITKKQEIINVKLLRCLVYLLIFVVSILSLLVL